MAVHIDSVLLYKHIDFVNQNRQYFFLILLRKFKSIDIFVKPAINHWFEIVVFAFYKSGIQNILNRLFLNQKINYVSLGQGNVKEIEILIEKFNLLALRHFLDIVQVPFFWKHRFEEHFSLIFPSLRLLFAIDPNDSIQQRRKKRYTLWRLNF